VMRLEGSRASLREPGQTTSAPPTRAYKRLRQAPHGYEDVTGAEELGPVVKELARTPQLGEVVLDVGEEAEFQWPARGGPVCPLGQCRSAVAKHQEGLGPMCLADI
jgi:hypothetical protein